MAARKRTNAVGPGGLPEPMALVQKLEAENAELRAQLKAAKEGKEPPAAKEPPARKGAPVGVPPPADEKKKTSALGWLFGQVGT